MNTRNSQRCVACGNLLKMKEIASLLELILRVERFTWPSIPVTVLRSRKKQMCSLA